MRRGGALLGLGLALCLAPSAFAADNDAKLQQKLERLEKENAELKQKLEKARQDTDKLFNDATEAERGAGLIFRQKPAMVLSPNAPATTPPVGAPPTKHGFSRLEKAELTLTVSFAAPRNQGRWRVHDMNCNVSKKNK